MATRERGFEQEDAYKLTLDNLLRGPGVFAPESGLIMRAIALVATLLLLGAISVLTELALRLLHWESTTLATYVRGAEVFFVLLDCVALVAILVRPDGGFLMGFRSTLGTVVAGFVVVVMTVESVIVLKALSRALF